MGLFSSTKKVQGLEIGDGVLRFVELEYTLKKKQTRLVRYTEDTHILDQDFGSRVVAFIQKNQIWNPFVVLSHDFGKQGKELSILLKNAGAQVVDFVLPGDALRQVLAKKDIDIHTLFALFEPLSTKVFVPQDGRYRKITIRYGHTNKEMLANELYKVCIQARQGGVDGAKEKIIAFGSSALHAPFLDYLADRLETPVLQGNPWTGLYDFSRDVPAMPLEESLRFVFALGAARQGLEG